MKITKFFKNAFSRKSNVTYPFEAEIPVPGALGRFLGQEGTLTDYDALRYYNECMPIATNVDRITKAFSDLPLRLEIDNKVVETHPMLDLLNHPNPDFSRRLFFQTLATHYLVTGNCYALAIGNISRPPREIYPVSPLNISIIQGDNGLTSAFELSGNMFPGSFLRKDQNGYRIFSNMDFRQLKQIRTFSSNDNSQYRGLSPLVPCKMDMKQIMMGQSHNYNMLSKGGRLTLLFSIKDEMSWLKFQEAKNQIMDQFSGTQGNTIGVVQADQIDVKEMGSNNRDMDFYNLQQMSEKAIGKRFGIPMQLINDGSSSYNNLSTAVQCFYDDAVTPLSRTILETLSEMLLPRYGLSQQTARLYADTSNVPAIAQRTVELTKQRREIYTMTDNELRREQSLEDIENGDSVWRPATWVNDEQYEEQQENVRLNREMAEDKPQGGKIDESKK